MLNKRYTGFRHNICLLSRLFNFSKLLVKLIKYPNLVFEIILYIKTIECIYNYLKKLVKEEDEVAGFFVFSHLWMRGNFRLGQVRVNEFPAGSENQPHRARKKEKSYYENTKKSTTSFSSFVPLLFYFSPSVCRLCNMKH